MLCLMKTTEPISHVTDDLGNDVLTPSQLNEEYAALCAVAEAADQDHRAHCLLPTINCAICKALADLDVARHHEWQARHN
jgi:hypothetical protein